MKSTITKTVLLAASLALFSVPAFADHHSSKRGYSGDNCDRPGVKSRKHSSGPWGGSKWRNSRWGASSKWGSPKWGASKHASIRKGVIIIDGKEKTVDQYFSEIQRAN